MIEHKITYHYPYEWKDVYARTELLESIYKLKSIICTPEKGIIIYVEDTK